MRSGELKILGKVCTGQYGEGVPKEVQELVGSVERLAEWLPTELRHGYRSNGSRM